MLIDQILRNRYRITKLLGKGGFGDTYLAEDLDLPNHPVCVVKHLHPKNPNPEGLQIAGRLFESEAQVLYRLGNECNQIPRLFAHFEEKGEFYLVQEFVDGEDLSREIFSGQQLSEAEVTKLLQEILEVLTTVHHKNIIHRDIKPKNLMRRHQDSKIVLIDFGAVKEISALTMNAPGQSTLTVAIGTKGYMPSEQANGQPKLCSDVYAVGMLAIYALTGIPPHQLPKDPTNGEVIWQNWANVSERLADILTKMVRDHFSQRYQSAAEALHALSPPPPQQPTINHQPPTTNSQQPTSRRRVIQTLVLMGAGFGLATVVKLLQNSPKNPDGPKQLPTPQGLSLQNFPFETVIVDAKGNITKRDNPQAKYFVENLGNGITLEMVQIPGGTFTMGSPAGEARREDNEGPQHQVTVPGFFMGKYEVTQAQYQEIMGNNPSYFTGEKRPVETVSWNDAVEFCKRLSQKTGRTYRLPSEAEWEYACRARTTTPFYFGETITTELVNYNGKYNTYASGRKGDNRQQTTDVGKFYPNSFGLYDMCGNVWEWCQDEYHNNYVKAPRDGSPWVSSDINDGLLRGGSWIFEPWYCRSASRVKNDRRNAGLYDVGFRLVALIT